jgi:hypothetical protein
MTCYVRKNEWALVKDWLLENWDYVNGISFLGVDDTIYPQQPLETISESEYLEKVRELEKADLSMIEVKNYEEMHSTSACDKDNY